MRTVHYVTGWPPDRFPSGIVTASEAVVSALREAGHDAQIVAMNGEARSGESHVAIIEEGAKARRIANLVVRVKGRLFPFSRILDEPARRIAQRINEMARSGAPDIVEMEESFGWSRLVASSVRAPVVTRLHGPYFLTGAAASGGAFSSFEKERIRREGLAIESAPLVTAPSLFVLDAARAHYGAALENARVIPNPARAPAAEHVWRRDRANPKEILFVGRFDRIKGADILLEAFARLAARDPELRLTFAGPAETPITLGERQLTREKLLAEIAPPDVAARIDFLGVVGRSELARLRARAFVTVVASRFETFPNVVLEAMAFGSPFVATRVGGIPDAARDNVDALLVPCEAEPLAAAIAALLDDPNRAATLGEAGRRRALTDFSTDRIAQMTLDAYAELTAGRSPKAARKGGQ